MAIHNTSDNINLIQHYSLYVNNSLHLLFSDIIEIVLYEELPFIFITKDIGKYIFYNIDLTARSPP